MELLTDKEKVNAELHLLTMLPTSSVWREWLFSWNLDGSLVAASAYKCSTTVWADFTLTFDPDTSLTQFDLRFYGQMAEFYAKKYKLRDLIDDELWNRLDSRVSLYELAKRK